MITYRDGMTRILIALASDAAHILERPSTDCSTTYQVLLVLSAQCLAVAKKPNQIHGIKQTLVVMFFQIIFRIPQKPLTTQLSTLLNHPQKCCKMWEQKDSFWDNCKG